MIPTSTENLLNELKETYERQEYALNELREENKKLKDEAYKDNELIKMKTKYEKMKEDYYRGFPISQAEDNAIENWINEHINTKHNRNSYAGVIGGRFTYEFTPTSIGTIGTVKCSCGESFIFQNI